MRTKKVQRLVWGVMALLLLLLAAGMHSAALAAPPPGFAFFYTTPPGTMDFGDTLTIGGRISGYYMPTSVELAYSFDESEWHQIATLPAEGRSGGWCGSPDNRYFDFSHAWTPPRSGDYYVRGRCLLGNVPGHVQTLRVAVCPIVSGYDFHLLLPLVQSGWASQ